MIEMVLVLAGLAAGDGGPGTGAAAAKVTETLRLDFARDWEGTVQAPRNDPMPVRLSGGRLTYFRDGRPVVTNPFTVKLARGGLVLGEEGIVRFHGICKVEGGRVLICVNFINLPRPTACTPRDGSLFILKPAARKP
jgi:hypothetical protein